MQILIAPGKIDQLRSDPEFANRKAHPSEGQSLGIIDISPKSPFQYRMKRTEIKQSDNEYIRNDQWPFCLAWATHAVYLDTSSYSISMDRLLIQGYLSGKTDGDWSTTCIETTKNIETRLQLMLEVPSWDIYRTHVIHCPRIIRSRRQNIRTMNLSADVVASESWQRKKWNGVRSPPKTIILSFFCPPHWLYIEISEHLTIEPKPITHNAVGSSEYHKPPGEKLGIAQFTNPLDEAKHPGSLVHPSK